MADGTLLAWSNKSRPENALQCQLAGRRWRVCVHVFSSSHPMGFYFFFSKNFIFLKLLEYCDYTGILLNTGRFDIVSNEYI